MELLAVNLTGVLYRFPARLPQHQEPRHLHGATDRHSLRSTLSQLRDRNTVKKIPSAQH